MATDQEAKTIVDEAHTLHKDQEEKKDLIRNPQGQRKRVEQRRTVEVESGEASKFWGELKYIAEWLGWTLDSR